MRSMKSKHGAAHARLPLFPFPFLMLNFIPFSIFLVLIKYSVMFSAEVKSSSCRLSFSHFVINIID